MEAADLEDAQASNTVPHLRVQAVDSEDAQANSMVPQLNREVAEDVHLSSMVLQPHHPNMELHLSLRVPHPVEVLHLSNTVPHLPHPSNTVPHPREVLLLSNTVPQAVEVDTAVEDIRLAPRLETVSRKLRLAATHRMAVDTLPTVDTAPVLLDRPSQPLSPSHTPRAEATTTKH